MRNMNDLVRQAGVMQNKIAKMQQEMVLSIVSFFMALVEVEEELLYFGRDFPEPCRKRSYAVEVTRSNP